VLDKIDLIFVIVVFALIAYFVWTRAYKKDKDTGNKEQGNREQETIEQMNNEQETREQEIDSSKL
jgi:heme/copper-type cytochrome/quinol oxidase subunit 2